MHQSHKRDIEVRIISFCVKMMLAPSAFMASSAARLRQEAILTPFIKSKNTKHLTITEALIMLHTKSNLTITMALIMLHTMSNTWLSQWLLLCCTQCQIPDYRSSFYYVVHNIKYLTITMALIMLHTTSDTWLSQ